MSLAIPQMRLQIVLSADFVVIFYERLIYSFIEFNRFQVDKWNAKLSSLAVWTSQFLQTHYMIWRYFPAKHSVKY